LCTSVQVVFSSTTGVRHSAVKNSETFLEIFDNVCGKLCRMQAVAGVEEILM
jgi:hypothetical protein